MNYRVKIIIFM